jgi:uncharacterized metal-binding protein
MRLPWNPVSDDVYVERIRRGVAFGERCRILLLSFNLLMICGAVWLGIEMVELLQKFAQPTNAPAVPLIFVSTAMVGLSLGLMISHAAHGIFSNLIGFRTERLLLKYHDRQSASDTDDDPDIAAEPASTEPEYVEFLQDDSG